MKTLVFIPIVLVAMHGYFLVSRLETSDYGWVAVHAICIVFHYSALKWKIKLLED